MQEARRDLPERPGETDEGVWPYVGVGCLTAVVGLVGGGMIAVLIAKFVGEFTGCHAEAETGAPCNWSVFWTWGAWIGLIAVPTYVLMRMRRKRAANKKLRNSE